MSEEFRRIIFLGCLTQLCHTPLPSPTCLEKPSPWLSDQHQNLANDKITNTHTHLQISLTKTALAQAAGVLSVSQNMTQTAHL